MTYDLVKVKVPYAGDEITTFVLMNEDFEPHIETTMYLADIARRKSDSTVSKHAYTLKKLVNVLEVTNGNKIVDVTSNELNAFANQYLVGKLSLGKSALLSYEVVINGFFKWLSDYDFIGEPPNVSFMKQRDRRKTQAEAKIAFDELYRTYLTKSEFQQLLSYVDGEAGSYKNLRDELALSLGYYSGCRLREISDPDNFTIEKIKKAQLAHSERRGLDAGFDFKIIGKGNKVRDIWIPTELSEKLLNFITRFYKGRSTGNIFCRSSDLKTPITDVKYASKVFIAAHENLLKAGTVENYDRWLQFNKSRRFHGLRHTYATNLAMLLRLNNLNYSLLQSRLGHENDKTTRIYIDFEAELHGVGIEKTNKIENSIGEFDLDQFLEDEAE